MKKVKIQDIIKAVTTTAGADGFLPSPKASEFIDIQREETVARNVFRMQPMGSKTLDIPKVLTGTEVFFQSTEASEATETSITSGTISLTAKKLMAWIEVSEESMEDSVGNFGQLITENFAREMAQAEEEAFLVGDVDYPDTTATKSSATATTWFIKDHRLAFDGLLTIGIESGTRLVAEGADMSVSIAREAIFRMGLFGKRSRDLVLFLNPWSANQMLDDSKLVTVDKYGPNRATILTGEIGKIFNQIVTFDSSFIPDGKGVLTNRRNAIIGDRRRIKMARDEIVKNDSVVWAISERVAFEVENDAGVVAITRLATPTAS